MNAAFQKRRARIGLLTITLAALFFVAAVRLFVLVTFDGPRLNSLAFNEHTDQVELAAVRGPIVDRNGEPLALSAETQSVYAHPRDLLANSDAGQRAHLASALGISTAELKRRLHHPAPFVWLARRISPERAQAAQALGLEGVGALAEYKRFYPESNLAASVVGLAGVDGQGLSGVELQYDKLIRGEPVKLRIYHDAFGHPILDSPVSLKQAQPGDRVELTIDSGIQSLAQNRLSREVEASGARAGSAIVLDPFSGQVLALVNIDPSRKGVRTRLHDAAIQDAYEPGSTIKGLLGAIALQDGAINLSRKIYCEEAHFHLGRVTIHDDSPHGWLNLAGIIEVSSNIGAAKIALQLGAERYYRGLQEFGVGQRTGIDLPGEASGILRKWKTWRDVDLADHGFGQGIAVTPMQLAEAYAAIANGGLIMRPYVVKAVYDADGDPVLVRTPQVMGRVLSPAVAHEMNVLLRGPVYGPDGTAHRAQVADFTVAGKTGTAQMVNTANGTYFQNRLNASFVGFLPANDPRLVILVVLYDVGHGHFGGLVAAPVFSAIATGAASELGIAAPRPAGYEAASVIPLDILKRAESLLSRDDDHDTAEAAKAPPPGVRAVPDFRGLSLRAALALARGRAMNVEVKGAGYVVAQDPRPGAPLLASAVNLKLEPAVTMAAAEEPKISPRMASAKKRLPHSGARGRRTR